MKNNFCRLRNCKGFSVVFLLLVLPALMALLGTVYRLVILIEFKREFRFNCLTRSSILQRELLSDRSDSLNKAKKLLEKLNEFNTNKNSPIKYYVTLSDYPKNETGNETIAEQRLVYQLKYSWLQDFYLNCGISSTYREGQWQHKIVYSTNVDKY